MSAMPSILSLAIEPKTRSDEEKLGLALATLAQGVSTFTAHTDGDSGQTILSGMSEVDLEAVVDRLIRECKVELHVGKPQVVYRETIRKMAEAEGKYIRQNGGLGNYAHIKIRLEPTDAGKGFAFVNAIKGGVVPEEYIEPTKQGIREAMQGGVLAGYEMVDLKATLFDGSYHEVESNEMAFRIAGAMACKEAARKASPVLLEPVMAVEVVVPEEWIGAIIGDLNSRRGRIESIEHRGGSQVIKAKVPLAEMFGYSAHLRSSTLDRASFSMKFDRCEICPDRWFGDDEPLSGVAGRKGPRPRGGKPKRSEAI